jgi:hypothetical protein
MKPSKGNNLELANLTISMMLSFAYLLVVCWVFPIIPMAMTWILGWPPTTLIYLWLGGLPFIGLAVYSVKKVSK